jgi:ATP-dependent Lhr-like helicase
LLLPQEKRVAFVDGDHKRRHKAVTSVEYAGRWSLLRTPAEKLSEPHEETTLQTASRESAVEIFARSLLRRYGVMFRRLLEREAFNVTWYELSRVYRRLEARGEIRGGYFVNGVSGEQFALPEAIGMLRSLRKVPGKGELITISGADPLNLAGILTPGPRVTAIAGSRLLLRDGVPVAALEGGRIIELDAQAELPGESIERALRVGNLPVPLRPYYT